MIEENINNLEELIDAIPTGIYITTIDGKIISLNNFLVKLLRVPSKEYLKKINLNEQGNFPNIIDRKKFIEQLQLSGHLENLINQYTTSSGEIIYVSENSTAIRDENGNIQYIIGTIEDITEKIILEKEERYIHQFMNIVNDALIHLVENPYMLSSIEYAFELIGNFLNISTIKAMFLNQWDKFPDYNDFDCVVNWNNINSKNLDNSLFKIILENFPNALENLMNGDNFFVKTDSTNEFQKYTLSKYNISSFLMTPIIYGNKFTGLILFADQDETRNWDEGTLKFLAIIGNAIGNYWNNFQNIKKIEELKNSLERIIEASRLGIWEYNVGKDKFESNSFFKELVNIPKSQTDLTCKTFFELIADEDKNRVNKNFEELFNGNISSINVDFKINSSPPKYLQLKGKVIQLDYTNKPEIISGILLDISELKILHKQLEETIRIKDKFFNIIAHDLKNPMNAVKSLLDDLLASFDSLSPEELFEAQSQIQKSISTLSQLVNNLLEWSRTQTGRIVINPDNIDVFYIISSSIDVNYYQAKIKNIEIINNVPHNTVVYADSNMLYTVFRNIISNAIKYTPNSGTVKISVKDLGDYYEFLVSDTGIGMTEEQLANIFSLEHIKSLPGTNQEKGTGLGLIISKEFVERNGGKISVSSKLNDGTTFSIMLPKMPQ
ncbi:MAG TPA: ATP-binding protein [Candidatus Kapabacteria bacterium]|nr:ATP-binding protein [Candidatus Kapabacteria bacterium]